MHRNVVFPNRVREQRLAHGHAKLMAFATLLPDLPYIRLSKIERGEVFARAGELARIAAAIGMDAQDLLIDVEMPDFDIARWFAPFADSVASDSPHEARFSVMLAAAVRRRRVIEPRLTAGVMDSEFGIAPVILSRIENAHKGLRRWNADIVAALCRLFGAPDEMVLRRIIQHQYAEGLLTEFAGGIADPALRLRRTAERVAELSAELRRHPPSPAPVRRAAALVAGDTDGLRRSRQVAVFGAPAEASGTIILTPLDTTVETPSSAGPRAFGVRLIRATLGLGLPGQATLIVDPDRYPQAGGLALVRDGDLHRVLAVLIGRDGSLVACSTQPEFEVTIDVLAPGDVAAIVAAHFV